MNKHNENSNYKFRPEYIWPEAGTEENCPKCNSSLQLLENNPAYYGKPWWCEPCQWQYSVEELHPELVSHQTDQDSLPSSDQ